MPATIARGGNLLPALPSQLDRPLPEAQDTVQGEAWGLGPGLGRLMEPRLRSNTGASQAVDLVWASAKLPEAPGSRRPQGALWLEPAALGAGDIFMSFLL